jgi:predicted O-methyltransferase YrrM
LFDIIFIDADKKHNIDYLKTILGDNNEHANTNSNTNDSTSTKISNTSSSRRLIKDGGIIIIDNTLWKGHVLDQVIHTNKYLYAII